MMDEFTDEITGELTEEYEQYYDMDNNENTQPIITIEELAKQRLAEIEAEIQEAEAKKENPLLIFPEDKMIPTWDAHTKRDDYQCFPTGILRSNGGKIFYDENNKEWFRVPWYLNLFHNPAKNIKLIHFDYHDKSGAVGSSEIIVSKSLIKKGALKGFVSIDTSKIDLDSGSYNFRDMYVTSHWRHFWADVYPAIIYNESCY